MYGSEPDVCEDEFLLSPGNYSQKVESLRDMITQQMGIDVIKGKAKKHDEGVKLEVG